jgi:hypothetical protein
MFNSNAVFPNNARNMEVLLEAFFNVQHNEHMKAWRWYLFERGTTVDRYGHLRCSRTGELVA